MAKLFRLKHMLLQDQKDVELMRDTGLEAYWFSISWSRLIPRGRGPVNPKGLEYYTNLITEITKRGMWPMSSKLNSGPFYVLILFGLPTLLFVKRNKESVNDRWRKHKDKSKSRW